MSSLNLSPNHLTHAFLIKGYSNSLSLRGIQQMSKHEYSSLDNGLGLLIQESLGEKSYKLVKHLYFLTTPNRSERLDPDDEMEIVSTSLINQAMLFIGLILKATIFPSELDCCLESLKRDYDPLEVAAYEFVFGEEE